jgi:hypothetical protein
MALNLSTLTSPTTSGDVLAEMLTTADFLDPVPVLRNIARGSNKGGDAKQTTALNQPKALPYDGKGYLYLSGVAGNYASVPDAANLNGITDFVMEAKDVYMGDWADAGLETFFSKYTGGNEAFSFRRYGGNINIYAVYGGVGIQSFFLHSLTGAATASIRVTRIGTSVTAELDTGSGYVAIGSAQTVPTDAIDTGTAPIEIGGLLNGSTQMLLGKIARAVIWDNGTQAGDPVLDVDFTATNIPHGAKKFQCATGQTVTINQSGNDPATVIKKSVLRFNGSTSGLSGLFNQTITGGHFFAAFSVLGGGGANLGRIFGGNSTGAFDYQSGGFTLRRDSLSDKIQVRYNGGSEITHSNVFDGARGDFLLESPLKAGDQNSKINNADADDGASSLPGALSSEEFDIGQFSGGNSNAAIDLEYLALFPATISDAEAARVVTYINNRNNVFDLKDGFGYYFFDPTDLAAGPVASWNGQIIGSDNDANLTITQTTAGSQPDSNQPTGSGMAVTFNDNNDHLDVPAGFVEPAAGSWQVVGTSLGTFAYKINNNSQTELNLLGNRGTETFRKAGDLYGIILLPQTAIGKDVTDARKLLIDRGASDAAGFSNYYAAWYQRTDIVEFSSQTFPDATDLGYAWASCISMTDFGTISAKKGVDFSNAWRDCSALTSFPAGAKLGTAAENVNFTSAWQSSGLTSFPADIDLSNGSIFAEAWRDTDLTSFSTPLPTAASLYAAWRDCTSLVSFSLGLTASNIRYGWYGCSSLTSFSAPLSSANRLDYSWRGCTSLTDFSADVFANWNPSSLVSGVFDEAWGNTTSLTAASVENILVGISNSGKHATSTGASTGNPLGNSGIDIDYNTVGGTSPLSAATNTAIASLRDTKGWSIFINGAEQTA